jgi:hypothetical protein
MDVNDPQHDAQDDEEQDDQAEDKNHVALALTGEIPFAHRGGIDDAFVLGVLFHSPNGRFGGLGGRRFTGLAQLFRQQSSLFGKNAFLFRQLPPPGFQRVRVVAVPRHDGRLSEKFAGVAWKVLKWN